jgi:acetyl-CoA acyltransferase
MKDLERELQRSFSRFKTCFEAGSVTAGNSSQMSDGAAFVLVMSEEMVKNLILNLLQD